jgi:hypothetical protein
VTLRYALYRFLAQGFRRCQSYWPAQISAPIGGLLPERDREFFSGRPVWNINGSRQGQHPGGFYRAMNAEYGAFYWTHDDPSLLDSWVWDTQSFWTLPGAQGVVEEPAEVGHVEGDPEAENIYD